MDRFPKGARILGFERETPQGTVLDLCHGEELPPVHILAQLKKQYIAIYYADGRVILGNGIPKVGNA